MLLGKLLVRRLEGGVRAGIIIEVEPYFGAEDPASRARRGGDLARVMCGEVCTALVYGVHRQWLLNVVAHEPGLCGAILIRGILPVDPGTLKPLGREVLGPGRVTRYFSVDKALHRTYLCDEDSPLRILDGLTFDDECISRSPRVGVREDLPIPLNFRIRRECLTREDF